MIKYSLLFFNFTFIFYFISTLSYVIFFVLRRERIGVFAFSAGLFGFSLHTLSLIIKTISLKYLPISNVPESLSFFAWTIMLVYFLVEEKTKVRVIGSFILPLVILLVGYASTLDNQIKPLLPALRSWWLGIHASLCFLGYACFTFAFSLGIMYLLQEKEVKSKKIGGLFFRLPSLGILDRLGYRIVILGFVFLTLGIITGAIWAQKAWGSHWSWDPKETWSLITWLIYLTYLHCRLMRGWQGKKSAYLAIIGFLLMLFTYFGVSFLLPGLHSYL